MACILPRIRPKGLKRGKKENIWVCKQVIKQKDSINKENIHVRASKISEKNTKSCR